MIVKRLISFIVLLPVALFLIAFIIANREMMVLEFNPFAGDSSHWQLKAPIFLFLFAFLGIGIMLGGVVTWAGQHKYRKAARRKEKEKIVSDDRSITLQENGNGHSNG